MSRLPSIMMYKYSLPTDQKTAEHRNKPIPTSILANQQRPESEMGNEVKAVSGKPQDSKRLCVCVQCLDNSIGGVILRAGRPSSFFDFLTRGILTNASGADAVLLSQTFIRLSQLFCGVEVEQRAGLH